MKQRSLQHGAGAEKVRVEHERVRIMTDQNVLADLAAQVVAAPTEASAKRGEKTDAVKKVLTANPEYTQTQVIAAVQEQFNLKVSGATVSNVKEDMGLSTPRASRPTEGKVAGLDAVMAVLEYIDLVGDRTKAIAQVNAVAELIAKVGGPEAIMKSLEDLDKLDSKINKK